LNEFHPPYNKKLISFSELPAIIENCKFIKKETDKKERPDVLAIYRFWCEIQIDNIDYDVILIIKETSKTFLYDHILLEKNNGSVGYTRATSE
jgi:hypothetical protein